MRTVGLVLALGVMGALWGCMPPSTGGGNGGEACDPGETQRCTCPDGSASTQICEDDERLSPCRCEGRGQGQGGAQGMGGAQAMGGNVSPPPDPGAGGQGMTPGCVPECGARECGLDLVCGESCGACGAGAFCDDGDCVTENMPDPPGAMGNISISQVYLSAERLEPGTRAIVTVLFTGEAASGRIVATETGTTIALGMITDEGQMEFTLVWDNINALSPLSFPSEGTQMALLVELTHPQGATARARESVELICRNQNAQQTAACDGVCAPNPAIGCACGEEVAIACIDDQAYDCGENSALYNCDDIIGDGTVRSECVPDLHGRGNGGCLMPPGRACRFTHRERGTLIFPCGRPGRVSDIEGCIDGVCRAGLSGCREPDARFCDGNILIGGCIDFVSFRQPYGIDCQHADIAGREGRCHLDHCLQPQEDGPCVPDIIECIGGLECGDIDDDGVGLCQRRGG